MKRTITKLFALSAVLFALSGCYDNGPQCAVLKCEPTDANVGTPIVTTSEEH